MSMFLDVSFFLLTIVVGVPYSWYWYRYNDSPFLPLVTMASLLLVTGLGAIIVFIHDIGCHIAPDESCKARTHQCDK